MAAINTQLSLDFNLAPALLIFAPQPPARSPAFAFPATIPHFCTTPLEVRRLRSRALATPG